MKTLGLQPFRSAEISFMTNEREPNDFTVDQKSPPECPFD
jgi:hypothetical protein